VFCNPRELVQSRQLRRICQRLHQRMCRAGGFGGRLNLGDGGNQFTVLVRRQQKVHTPAAAAGRRFAGLKARPGGAERGDFVVHKLHSMLRICNFPGRVRHLDKTVGECGLLFSWLPLRVERLIRVVIKTGVADAAQKQFGQKAGVPGTVPAAEQLAQLPESFFFVPG